MLLGAQLSSFYEGECACVFMCTQNCWLIDQAVISKNQAYSLPFIFIAQNKSEPQLLRSVGARGGRRPGGKLMASRHLGSSFSHH